MVVSSRAVAALGLGIVGAACLAGPSLGQQAGDPAARKTATQAQGAAPTAARPQPAAPAGQPAPTGQPAGGAQAARPQPPSPAIFGTVDLEAVFKAYDKVKAQQDEFKAAADVKQKELMKLQAEGQEEAQKLQKLTPNTVDYKKIEDKLTTLKAQIEAGRESAQREFALRESEMLATLYKEIQEMVSMVAQYRGMTYVMQVSNEPVAGSNPNSVMAAMSRAMVYADPRNDVTEMVVLNLNKRYRAVSTGTSRTRSAATPAGN